MRSKETARHQAKMSSNSVGDLHLADTRNPAMKSERGFRDSVSKFRCTEKNFYDRYETIAVEFDIFHDRSTIDTKDAGVGIKFDRRNQTIELRALRTEQTTPGLHSIY